MKTDPVFNKKNKKQENSVRTVAEVKNDNILLEGDGLDMSLGNFLDGDNNNENQ